MPMTRAKGIDMILQGLQVGDGRIWVRAHCGVSLHASGGAPRNIITDGGALVDLDVLGQNRLSAGSCVVVADIGAIDLQSPGCRPLDVVKASALRKRVQTK